MSVADFLSAVIPALTPEELVELRASHHGSGEVRRQWYRRPAPLITDAAAWAADGYHVWCGINPRLGRRGGDRWCSRSQALPADIDGKLWGSLARADQAVRAFEPRPSVAVMSGGGIQCYWLLECPVDLQCERDAGRYRAIAHRLAWALCGLERQPDRVNNPERVLRLPDTLNWKYDPPRPVCLLWCEAERRYSLTELEDWCDRYAPWTAPEPVHPLPRDHAPQDGVIADFNARYDALVLLTANGARVQAQHGGTILLTRPGKQQGTSATWNHVPNCLIVFTEEWPPFVPWSIPGQRRRGYDAFEIFSLLEHGGQRGRAYGAAQEMGYGMKTIYGIPSFTGNSASALRSLLPPSQNTHNSNHHHDDPILRNSAINVRDSEEGVLPERKGDLVYSAYSAQGIGNRS